MARFADFPYFLIENYINDVFSSSIPYTTGAGTVFSDYLNNGIIVQTSGDPLNTHIITDNDVGVSYTETDTLKWNYFSSLPTGINEFHNNPNIVLRGSRKGINTKGGRYVEIFIKMDDGFLQAKLDCKGQLLEEKNIFVYGNDIPRSIIPNITSSPYATNLLRGVTGITGPLEGHYYNTDTSMAYVYPTGVYYNEDVRFYTIDGYGRTNGNILSDYDINGREVYFRKDSLFHDWIVNIFYRYFLENYNMDVRDYLNTDKDFIYFGKIFQVNRNIQNPSQNRYHIEFIGLKDYVMRCLPINNRKDNLRVFLDNFFDGIYHRNYNQLKDIWSLIDPYECDDKFLHLIENYYGLPNTSMSLTNKREYLDNIIHYLKSKGTFTALFILYKVCSNNSNNIFNIYEYWHEYPPSTGTLYEKHLHTSAYYKPHPNGESVDRFNYVFNPANSRDAYIYVDLYGKNVINKYGTGVYSSFDITGTNTDHILVVDNKPVLTSNGKVYLESGETFKYDSSIMIVDSDGYYRLTNGDYVRNIDGNKINKTDILLVNSNVVTGPDGGWYLKSSDSVELYKFKSRGAGNSWYDRFNYRTYPQYSPDLRGHISTDTNRLVINSPTYEVNIDITDYPIGDLEVLPKIFTDNFFGGCRELRPINRVDKYTILLTIKSSEDVLESIQYTKSHNSYMQESYVHFTIED